MVLDEMSRNLRKRINATTQDTRRLEALMNDFLPEALVQDARFDIKLPETVSVHPKDRHVLQAALCVNANIIVTDNLKDLSLIHISEPTRPVCSSRMPSSA